MKIQYLAFDRYEGQAPRIALELADGLNVIDARQPLLARQLADLAGHVLYGARVCDRDAIVHDHPGYLDIESNLGRFRLDRHADRANRGTYTEPRLTVAPLDGHTAQPGTARDLLGGLSPEVAARLLVLRRSDDDQLQWLLAEPLATELHRLKRVHPNRPARPEYLGDASDLFAVRDSVSHQIELLLSEKRRSSEALEAALKELDLESESAHHRLADVRRELDEVLASLAELETQLRYRELSEYVGRASDEAYHSDQQPLLAGLDEEIAKWRRALADLEAREAQVRHQLSQLHPDDSSPWLPLADQRAAVTVAQRLVDDLNSEVARYARPSDSPDCLCKHTHARLHPLIDTLADQIAKLGLLVEQYEAAVAIEQLKLEAVHLERSQHELRATIDHLLDRRQSRLRTSRARRTEITELRALPADWQRLRADLEQRRSELTHLADDAQRHLQHLAARHDALHRERAELMNDSNLSQLRQQLDDITRRIDSGAPRVASTTGYSTAPWRASDILAKLSDGRLREVRLTENGRRATVINRQGNVVRQSDLNEVDRRLLTISLQLAAIAGAAQWGLRLPLLVADPFAELPAVESSILALVLQDMGRAGHQVLLSTGSTAVVDRLRSTGQAILAVDTHTTAPADEAPVATGLRAYSPTVTTKLVEVEDEVEDNGCALSLTDPIERFAVFGEDTQHLFGAIAIHHIHELLDADPDDVSHALDRTGISSSIVELWQTHVAMLVYVPELTLFDAQLLTSAGIRNLQQLADADADELTRNIKEYLASPRGVRYRSRQGSIGRAGVGRWISNARRNRSQWGSTHYASERAARPARRSSSRTSSRKGKRSAPRATSNGASRPATRTERPLRFRLSRTSPVVDAPSVGPKTAQRLAKVGIKTVADLLAADCDETATALNVRHITAETLVAWQHQAQLMCRVPELLARDVQVLVGCGFTTPEGIASAEASDLLEFSKSYLATPEGSRALRNGEAPDLARVKKWIYWAEHRRALEAA